jgi:hypothetical protein
MSDTPEHHGVQGKSVTKVTGKVLLIEYIEPYNIFCEETTITLFGTPLLEVA